MARIEAGLPQYKLAARAEINPVRLSRIENLHVEPNERERSAFGVQPVIE